MLAYFCVSALLRARFHSVITLVSELVLQGERVYFNSNLHESIFAWLLAFGQNIMVAEMYGKGASLLRGLHKETGFLKTCL